jgi:hypothetical protein
MRIYDPRLGRFLSVDPLTQEYPYYTPYQFAGNKPIWAVDLDGAEELISNEPQSNGTVLRVYNWSTGLRKELDYPNGAMATHVEGDEYWRFSRTNEYGRSQLYRSKGQAWELYVDEEADYRQQIKVADQTTKAILAFHVVTLAAPFSGISAGVVTLKGIAGGVADLSVQYSTNGKNINDINWMSVGGNVVLGNPVASAAFGSAFDSRQGQNIITGDKSLETFVSETAAGTVGNVVGGKLSDMTGASEILLLGAQSFYGNVAGNTTSSIIQPLVTKVVNSVSPNAQTTDDKDKKQ